MRLPIDPTPIPPEFCAKTLSREIIFEVFQPMSSRYLNVTDRPSDGRTERATTYCGIITALRIASCGKSVMQLHTQKVMCAQIWSLLLLNRLTATP